MRTLAYDSYQVPPSYQVEPGALSIESRVIAGGGSSDIRRGRLGDMVVAVKTLRSRAGVDPNDVRKVGTLWWIFSPGCIYECGIQSSASVRSVSSG